MMVNSLIDLALEEIARNYPPGALAWMKRNRPNEWGIMLTLEGRINRTCQESDLRGLRDFLGEYQELTHAMVKEFKAPKEKKGQGTVDTHGQARGTLK